MSVRVFSLILILASTATGCVDQLSLGQHSQALDVQPRLAFSSNRSGTYEIFTAAPDGTDVTLLTAGGQPAWSNDGTKLAFVNSGILWTMDRDGSNLQQWGNGAGNAADPQWSRDGCCLLYTDNLGIRELNLSNYNNTLVQSHWYCQVDGAGMCTTPRYSADGGYISYVRSNVYGTQVEVMASPLVNYSDWSDSPTWTFDGYRIVYTTAYSGTVYVVNSNTDGSDPAYLVAGFDISVPAISPDGGSVAYQYSASSEAPARIWIKPNDGEASQLIPDVESEYTYEDVELAWSQGS